MKLIDLVEKANKGYRKNFPESDLRQFVDNNGRPLDPMPNGDTLAVWVVREIYETFDPDATDLAQVEEIIRVIQNGIGNLNDLVAEFEWQEWKPEVS